MKKNKEFKGLWYLPSNPENKIGGTLIIKSEKIVLELFGCYHTESESIKRILENKVSTVETIYGDINDNKKITLFNCRESLNINSLNSVHLSTYECLYTLEGLHLNSTEDKFFDKISLYSPIFSQWKQPAIIEKSFYFGELNNKVKKVEVSTDQDSYWKKNFDITEGYQLTLSGESQFNGNFENTEFNFSQTTVLSIVCKENKSFSVLLEKVFLTCKFITLATQTPILITELFLYNQQNIPQNSDPIKLYFISKKKSTQKVDSTNFLFTYDDISDIFPEVILKWFKESDRLAPIRNHLIASIQQKGYFSSLDFLTIIQSLEGYHQRFIGTDKILKERINDLINNFNAVHLIRNSNIKVDRVVKTRNYYSHFYDRKGNELLGQELLEETNKLRVLLTCCVLSLIGFDNSKINEILNKKNSIKRLF